MYIVHVCCVESYYSLLILSFSCTPSKVASLSDYTSSKSTKEDEGQSFFAGGSEHRYTSTCTCVHIPYFLEFYPWVLLISEARTLRVQYRGELYLRAKNNLTLAPFYHNFWASSTANMCNYALILLRMRNMR